MDQPDVTSDDTEVPERASFVGRLMRLAERVSQRRPQLHPVVGIGIALTVFVGATAVAFAKLPPLQHGVRWWALVLVAVVAWIGAFVVAAEFMVSAALLGHHVRFVPALRVAVLATAANMLPIPGAVIVRTRELNRIGATYGRAVSSAAVVGLGFIGMSLLSAGALLVVAGPRRLVGTILFSVAIVVMAGTLFGLRSLAGRERTPKLFAYIVLVEGASVILKAALVGLAIYGVGFSVTLPQMFTLAIAYVVSLALGIFPSGLGITELLVALLSPAVGIDAAVGLLATSVRRLVELVAFAGLAIVMALREVRETRAARRATLTSQEG